MDSKTSDMMEDDAPLFRHAALSAAKGSALGESIGRVPVSWTIISALLFSMTLSLVAVVTFGSYNRVETVAGIVRSADSNIRVTIPSAGTVSEVFVKEGQWVKRGTVLLTVDTRRLNESGRPNGAKSIYHIDSQIEDYKKRLIAANKGFIADRSSLVERINAVNREMEAAEVQRELAGERLSLAHKAYAKLAPVAEKGFISGETLRQRKDEEIALKLAVVEAEAARSRLLDQLNTLKAAVSDADTSLIRERGELNDGIVAAQRQRDDITAQQEYAVVSPIDGYVDTLQAVKGQSIDAQIRQMSIKTRPSDFNAYADLYIPSRSAGFIQKGQEVTIRYDAYPWQEYGTASGTIQSISSSLIRPDDISTSFHLQEPVFLARVKLKSRYFYANGERHYIRTGLTFSADIKLDKRPIYLWIFDPIFALHGNI